MTLTVASKRIHSYVKAFLSNRTAMIGINVAQPNCHDWDKCGSLWHAHNTQQRHPTRALYHPYIPMIGLAKKLQDITNIKDAMYTNDITICIIKGSLGKKEAKLQPAATCVEQYIHK